MHAPRRLDRMPGVVCMCMAWCNLFVLFSVLDSSHIDRTCTPFGGAGSVGQGDTNTPNYIKKNVQNQNFVNLLCCVGQ